MWINSGVFTHEITTKTPATFWFIGRREEERYRKQNKTKNFFLHTILLVRAWIYITIAVVKREKKKITWAFFRLEKQDIKKNLTEKVIFYLSILFHFAYNFHNWSKLTCSFFDFSHKSLFDFFVCRRRQFCCWFLCCSPDNFFLLRFLALGTKIKNWFFFIHTFLFFIFFPSCRHFWVWKTFSFSLSFKHCQILSWKIFKQFIFFS